MFELIQGQFNTILKFVSQTLDNFIVIVYNFHNETMRS
jgi:hypothetical protein